MLCYEVWLNEKKLHVIGHKDAIALIADVTFLNKNDTQFIGLHAITHTDSTKSRECFWEAPQIGQGDEVRIKLVETDTPQAPDHEMLFGQGLTLPWSGEKTQCSFCGKAAAEGKALFEGFDARICENCIEFRHGIIAAEEIKSP
jgi:hypothetical protein